MFWVNWILKYLPRSNNFLHTLKNACCENLVLLIAKFRVSLWDLGLFSSRAGKDILLLFLSSISVRGTALLWETATEPSSKELVLVYPFSYKHMFFLIFGVTNEWEIISLSLG